MVQIVPLPISEDIGLMHRLTYVPTEISTNEAAINAAVSTFPGNEDKGSVRVWWDVK